MNSEDRLHKYLQSLTTDTNSDVMGVVMEGFKEIFNKNIIIDDPKNTLKFNPTLNIAKKRSLKSGFRPDEAYRVRKIGSIKTGFGPPTATAMQSIPGGADPIIDPAYGQGGYGAGMYGEAVLKQLKAVLESIMNKKDSI